METEEDKQRQELIQTFKRDFFGFDVIDEEKLSFIINKTQNENVKNVYKCINVIIPLIRKMGFNVDIVPLPISEDGVYWSDYADTYLNEKYKHQNDFFLKDFMYFTVYLDERANINVNRDISISFSELIKEQKCSILALFYEHLLNNFSWNGDNNKIMSITYEPIENPTKLNFDLLRSDDRFPLLHVFISFRITKDYGLFDYLEKDNIISEIENILENEKITCSYGHFDIEITGSVVDMKEVDKIYKKLTTILSKVKRKNEDSFGVKSCKFYYYDEPNSDKCKKCKINCDPLIKERLYDFKKYLR